MRPRALDHIALRVHDAGRLAETLAAQFDLRTDTSRFGQTALFADGDTAAGVVLEELPNGSPEPFMRLVSIMLHEPEEVRQVHVMAPEGVTVTTGSHPHIEAGTPRHSLIALTLRSNDPPLEAAEYTELYGFKPVARHQHSATVRAGGALLTLVRERVPAGVPGALVRMGLRVRSLDHQIEQAAARELFVRDLVRGGATPSMTVEGPAGLDLKYLQTAPVAVSR